MVGLQPFNGEPVTRTEMNKYGPMPGFRVDQQQAFNGAKYGWQKFFDGLERVVAGLQ